MVARSGGVTSTRSTAGAPAHQVRHRPLESRAEVLRFYLKLNRGGTVHSDAEIDRVKHLLVLEEAKEQNL